MPAATIYDALRQSHDRQRALVKSMNAGRAAPEKRRQAFLDLAVELEAHAAAEERYLYVPILMLDAGLTTSRHALSEHHEMEEMVDDLRGVDPDTDTFRTGAKELAHKVRHHLDEEETTFFQVSGKLLTATQKRELRTKYLADYVRLGGGVSKHSDVE